MNIFVLDESPLTAAEMHCDKHVGKMTLEVAQMLSTINHKHGKLAPYKPTHANHPCVLWAEANTENYQWLVEYGKELGRQFYHRFDKHHKSTSVVYLASLHRPDLPYAGRPTEPVQCMPAHLHSDNTVESYRRFYHEYKSYFATWERGVEAPDWWDQEYANLYTWNTPIWRDKVAQYARALRRKG
ncbi:MAG: hypothetical protein GTO63_05790 [Anaerolineae bacterium]|nr:hypothetical protein [Anaerolineae bacterium]NIN94485.1 hypothetical protein [Anaerolineae bacterium]NIQ77553.1 hypothetical protein [Anaerolineae bacterium]